METRYNVYIFGTGDDNQNDVTLIGSNMTERLADRRMFTGCSRINRDFNCDYFEVGSPEDIKMQELLKKGKLI